MIMTVKSTPTDVRVSVTTQRKHPSAGRQHGTIAGERTSQSVARTKRLIRELADCNEFDYAVTLEFSPNKVPVSKQEYAIQSILLYFKNLKTNYPELKWLLIPEYYPGSGKRIHVHGLLAAFPSELLLHWRHRSGRHPIYVCHALEQGIDIYTIPSYNNLYGYAMVSICNKGNGGTGSQNRAVEYALKDLAVTASKRPATKRLFYTSMGLQRPTVIGKGIISSDEEILLSKSAVESYPHRDADTGIVYGRTYIFK